MTLMYMNREGSHAQVARQSKVRRKKRSALLFLRHIRLRRSLARLLAIRNGDDASPYHFLGPVYMEVGDPR